MPLEIQNQALYADRTVQDWHRRVMPRNADAIDVDLMGVCPHSWCRKSLYAYESTTNPNKPVSILRRLAMDAQLVGIAVFHDTDGITGHRVIYDPWNIKVSENPSEDAGEALEAYCMRIRAYHEVTAHRS
jgi:hypothetical protein